MVRRCCLIVIFLFAVSFSWAFAQERDLSASKTVSDETTQKKSVTTPANQEVTQLQEIIVTTTPLPNPVTPVITRYATQHNVVSQDQIKEQHGLDFQSALRNVPGVMFQSKNLMGSQTSHSLYIRGRGASHPSSDFAILYDDVPRFGALFGQVLGDGMALPTIGSIEIFKSPQPSEFGSGYASVNVKPKYLKDEGQEAIIDVSGGSFNTFGQSLSAGIKKGPYDIYVAQNWASTDGHVRHSRAQQQGYYANAGYDLTPNWSVRVLANYVESQTLAPMPETSPAINSAVRWPMAERFDTATFLSTVSLNHRYEKVEGYLKAYVNDTDFDLLQELNNGVRYGNGTGGLWSRQHIRLYGLRMKEKLSLWEGGEIVAGIDADLSDMRNTQRTYSGLAAPGINGGLAERVWEFPQTTILSPYVAVSQLFGRMEGFHITPSASYRYMHHNRFQSESSWQAGLVTGYAHTHLNVNYARGLNYPSPIILMNMVLASNPAINPDALWETIKPETVDHYEIGLTHTWPRKASLGATAFYDKGKNRYQAYMFGPIPISFNDPIGEYEIRGLELTGTFFPLKTLECFAGATFMAAKAKGSDGLERKDMPYTPGFQFQAGVHWSFLEHFKLRVDMQYLKDVYSATSMRTGNFNFALLNDNNKLEDFALVNGRLGYTFDYKPLHISDSEVYVAVNNIFNRHYEYAKGYSMPGITAFAGLTLRFM